MADFQVTIVGLGVTGTSLGLALKKASKELRVVGHDRESAAAAAARKVGAVDATEWNLPKACRGASILVLALPLSEIRETLAAVAPDLAPGCLVTDTAPLKAPVLAWARELLPAQVHFVGGDPIGVRGAREAGADLFSNTTYCLCPEASTAPEAVDRASDLAQAVGANPRFLDATEHDGLVAGLDQLPFMISMAVFQAAASSPAWREMANLGSARFDRLAGLLGDSPGADLQGARANAANIRRWLDDVQVAVDGLRTLLDAQQPADEEAIRRLSEARAAWERHDTATPVVQPDLKPFSVRRLLGIPGRRDR